MPQAKKAQTEVPAEPQAEPQSDFITLEIQAAKELEYQRGQLGDQINSNREALRLFDARNMLDEDQGAWLDLFYPLKGRGTSRTKEETEATRKAKEAARKEVADARGTSTPTADPEADDE